MTESVPVLTTPTTCATTHISIPTRISAMQWTGENPYAVQAFVGMRSTSPLGGQHKIFTIQNGADKAELYVAANDRWLPLEIGEWIIKDTLGFYPCKDEVFQHKYRAAPAIPEDTDVTRLYATTDAMVWAEEFCKMNPHVDDGTMLGWFANAMQTAIDLTKRKLDHDLIISADMRRHLERMFDGPIEVRPRSLDMTTVDANPLDITADGGSRTPGIEVRNIVLVTKARNDG